MNITDLRDSWVEAAHTSRHRARTDPEHQDHWEGQVMAFDTGLELLTQHIDRPRQALTGLHEAVNDALAARPTKPGDAEAISARAHQLRSLVSELTALLG